MKKTLTLITLAGLLATDIAWPQLKYPIIDTAQTHCYDNQSAIEFPNPGKPFFGQDAQYSTNLPNYKINENATVSDQVTGLMWTQDPGAKVTYDEAVVRCVRGGNVIAVTTGPKLVKPRPLQDGPQRGGFIKRLDKDGNGSVSKDEFDGPKQHFQHLDKNGDGVIGEDEAPKGPPSTRKTR